MPQCHRLQLTIALVCSMAVASGQIPNGGFENWADQGGYLDPTGWLTYNEIATAGGRTVEPGTPGFPGNSHAVITSRAASGGSPVQGWLSAGVSGSHSGFPYTTRPATLTGQWQCDIQLSDTGQALVALSKWNNITSSSDPIAYASIEITGSLSTWQPFSVPLTYVSSETPDTAYIQIVSSIDFGSPVVGSVVKVDDLAFTGTVGFDEHAGPMNLLVFPSPAADELNVLSTEAGELRLFDATGRVVLRQRITVQVNSLDVSSLAPGLFTYQFIAPGGKPIATGRLVKE